ncbi:hypothetical protein [uncultured Algibacter sp.]|uniref:hypothetical protein n=1 Tax=uncultured Algibacter sp. TaxID=298659 RepID=UPI00261C4C15|nr:hypothetical protein [uncultured Algibacter sp.]
MAISIDNIFSEFGLDYSKAYNWNQKLDANFNGVYLIALTNDPKTQKPHSFEFDICEKTFDNWIKEATDLEIDGNRVTDKGQIKEYLKQFWNPNENILYIGESSSKTNPIQDRVKQFYTHKVGKKGPHTGGYWLKLLSCLSNVSIYYAESNNPREIEFKMLMKFIELSSGKSFFEIKDFANFLPFANVKIDVSKRHTLKKHYNNNKRKK